MWYNFQFGASCLNKRKWYNSYQCQFYKVSPAGWDKNLEKDVKMLMSLSESRLYMGQERSFIHSEENGMGFIEQSPS